MSADRPGTDRGRRIVAYLLLLGMQTAIASFLFWTVLPVLQRILLQSGVSQPLSSAFVAKVVTAASLLQACYWTRYRLVPIWVPFHSAPAGLLLMFASRASFFFGGALFSAIFFRHLPQLEALPPLGAGIAKALGILALLFALFCYSLELERLGRAMEERPQTS